MQSSRVASGATDEPCARTLTRSLGIKRNDTPSPDRAGNYASTRGLIGIDTVRAVCSGCSRTSSVLLLSGHCTLVKELAIKPSDPTNSAPLSDACVLLVL